MVLDLSDGDCFVDFISKGKEVLLLRCVFGDGMFWPPRSEMMKSSCFSDESKAFPPSSVLQ